MIEITNPKRYSSKLLKHLFDNEDYIKYCKIYDNENRIDIELLKLILESEKDLYYLFLKNYVFFYFKKYIGINEELKEVYKHKGRKITTYEIQLQFSYIDKFHNRIRDALKVIITNKLVNKDELELLKDIFNKDFK